MQKQDFYSDFQQLKGLSPEERFASMQLEMRAIYDSPEYLREAMSKPQPRITEEDLARMREAAMREVLADLERSPD